MCSIIDAGLKESRRPTAQLVCTPYSKSLLSMGGNQALNVKFHRYIHWPDRLRRSRINSGGREHVPLPNVPAQGEAYRCQW